MKDLILISLKAHYNYMSRRIHNNSKRNSFQQTMTKFIEYLPQYEYYQYVKFGNKDSGYNLAVDTYNEICYNIRERFENGHSSDDFIERLL